MAKKISIEVLAGEMAAYVKEYTDTEAEKAKKVVKRVGRKCAANLRESSPERTGDYASGWNSRDAATFGEGAKVVVSNRAKPSLTHLLEKGHENRDGSFAKAIPHIAPAYEQAVSDLEAELQ